MDQRDKKYIRRLEVLKELIEVYIDECAPVSSEHIYHNLKATISPATIRNTLAELDKLGWTIQPHSSSGRVPSWKAYRTYIDMLRNTDFSDRSYTKEFTNGLIDFEMSYLDIGPALQRVSSLISEFSGYCGIVLSPHFDNDFIRQIRLLPLDYSRVLVALISDFGLIRTEIMQINRKIGIFSQRRIEDYLNERLHSGTGTPEASRTLYSDEEKNLGEEVYNEIVLKYLINLRPEKSGEVFIEGISRIFSHPELQVPKAVQSVIGFFEDKNEIISVMREAVSSRRVFVRIGEELDLGTVSARDFGFGLIAAPYEFNSMNVGAVGLIGPIRMHYRKLMPLIGQVAEFLTKRLSMSFRKPRISFDRDIPFKVMQ